MKNIIFTAVKFLITLIYCFNSIAVKAQAFGMAATVPVDGYVVTDNGDTLTGKIVWRLKYVENNPVEIKFITPDGETQIYKAGEIPGFGNYIRLNEVILNEPVGREIENYVSMPSMKKDVPVFFNRLLDGRIRIFLNRSSNQLGYQKTETWSTYDGISFNFIPGKGLFIGPRYLTSFRVIEEKTRFSSYLISKEDGELFKLEKSNYESLFNTLFSDCQIIQDELNKNPELKKFKNFMLLAELYNQLCK